MYPISIIVFFVLCYAFGYLATFLAKNSDHFFERHMMRVGIGLGVFVVLGYTLNLLHISLDYRIFLTIATLGIFISFAYQYWKTKTLNLIPSFSINIPTIGMLILFFATFSMYHMGAFSYPYLENDDPWAHAVGTKYISLEKTAFAPIGGGLHYVDPYPPAYDLVMGILHQTNTSIYWTLKFFNALFISLCIPFFYYFTKQLTASSKKAFYSTAVLFAVPAFMSHFIWALVLVMPLLFVAFYCFERISEDKFWTIPSALVTAVALTIAPTHSTFFGIFLGIYLLLKTVAARRFLLLEYGSSFGGLLLSIILWWLPVLIKHKISGISAGIGFSNVPTVLSIAGTADRQYYMADFIHATSQNMINNPIGFGFAASLFFSACVILLLIHHMSTIRQHVKLLFTFFIFGFGALLILLSHFYVKYVQKRNRPPLDVGSVPFQEFFFDQTFMIAVLAVLFFMLILLAIKTWKDPEFKEKWLLIAFGWGLVAFYAVMASPFHIKLSPFRAWMILAIPFSLLAGEGISLLSGLIRGTAKSIHPSIAGFAVIAALLLFGYGMYATSFSQKLAVNTAQWSPGGFWTSNEEISGYVWMHQNLPPNTPVFSFSNPPLIIAFDKHVCWWCSEIRDFVKNKFNASPIETTNFLKTNGYTHLLIDGQTAKGRGINETTAKIDSLIREGYTPTYQNTGFILLKVPISGQN